MKARMVENYNSIVGVLEECECGSQVIMREHCSDQRYRFLVECTQCSKRVLATGKNQGMILWNNLIRNGK